MSAGRVQTPALRLIVEREKEITAFQPKEFWEIEAIFQNQLQKKQNKIRGLLIQINGKDIDKFAFPDKKSADQIVTEIKNKTALIKKIEKSQNFKNPLPPFTTSTLQQAA